MAMIERSITVDASIEAAFDYLANFENSSDWDPGVAGAQRREGTPPGVGATYDLDVLFNGRHLPMVYTATRWDRPDAVVLEGVGSTVLATDTIGFESLDERRTRVNYRAELRLRGVLALVAPLMRRRFEAVGDAATAGIEREFARR